MTKLKLIVASLAVYLICNYSCKPIEPVPEPPVLGASTLILDANYLFNCDEFTQSSTIELEVVVDIVTSNGTPDMVDIQLFDIDNDDFDPDNLEFDIEIPENGTFTVTVTSRFNQCHQCCGEEPQISGNGCDLGEGGRPRFRGVSLTVNADPPPDNINVTPEFAICAGCGC